LKHAAAKGAFELVREILESGFDVNTTDKHGRTALHIAAANGHFQVVEELLSFGANVNLAAEGGQTPLHTVAFWGNTIRFDLPAWMAETHSYWGRFDAKQVNYNVRLAIHFN